MASRGPSPFPSGGLKAVLVGGNTVGAAVREREPRADDYRHVDTPGLIRKLRDLSVNTYLYGIWDSPTDFDDLRREFLPAAEAAGISVIPYLVPPSETSENGRASRPFLLDFVTWATEIAELSTRHKNLVAWAIDDFEFELNAKLFTPEYMQNIVDAAAAVNPELRFYTCAYYGAATSDGFLDKYGPYVDGIIYPFLDGHHENTTVAGSLAECLDAVLEFTRPRELELIPLIYAGRFLDAPLAPTEDYVAATLEVAAQYAADGRTGGTIAYGTQLDDAPTPASDNKAMYGTGRLALIAPRVPVPAGATAAASQVVDVDPSVGRQEISFWYHRWFHSRGVQPGTYMLELLIDDVVAWGIDIAEQPWAVWTQGDGMMGPVDVTAHTRGRDRVRVSFRLRALRDVSLSYVDVGVDNVETIGLSLRNGGFDEQQDWDLTMQGPLLAVTDLFVPDRPARIRRAVTRSFAAN
ncbi:hypothetical protein HPO96_34230 [Kribbella sandramycini]|uniref:Uncharacterized protein n=1 Tax=Kribbella sandramycini TaxID=60450 RepID=A0A7Y4P4L1_9ACTN|nr:hypothetical protein [Kribbella sandramycini]MBB6570459.1 hypothetical protein [Kribbella sandramycini]NOL45319.1 hypothetical protein [Kribbella sandramycini]